MKEGTRKVIVVTPVRNEEWIIGAFLIAVLKFADRVILLDHNSTDRTVDIAESFENVDVLHWPGDDFSELERRKCLLRAARMYGKNNLIFSLDADEIPAFKSIDSKILSSLRQREPGSHFRFKFANVLPGFTEYWQVTADPMAFVDDDSDFDHDHMIHFPRLPQNRRSKILEIPDIAILHMQYLNWSRMQSKHRWYQMWERISFPKKPAIEIYRRYHHMEAIPREQLREIPNGWTDLNREGDRVLMELGAESSGFWWDAECRAMMQEYSKSKFRYINLFDSPSQLLRERLFFSYAAKTQRFMGLSISHPVRLATRLIDKTVMRFFK